MISVGQTNVKANGKKAKRTHLPLYCSKETSSKTPSTTAVFLNDGAGFCTCATIVCIISFKILEGLVKHFGEKDNKSDSLQNEIDCPNCGEMFCFKYDVVLLNPRDVPERTEFNERSFNYLQELKLTHSKKPMKNKKKKKDKSKADDASKSRKRSYKTDETTDLTKKTKL